VALLGLLVVAPLAALPGLVFNNAPEAYLPPGAEAVAFERSLRQRFPEDQVLVLLLEGPGLWRADTLRAVDRLAGRLRRLPRVERVLSVTTVDHIQATAGGFAVEPLIDPRALDRTTPRARRSRATGDPLAEGRLVSPDGSAMAVVVRPVPLATSPERLALERAVRRAVDEAGLASRLTAVAGEVALDAAEFRAMVSDSLRFLPITAVIGLGLVGLLFRRVLAVVLTAAAIGAVMGPVLALLVLAGQPYTLIHAMVGPLLTGLTVALALHLFGAMALAGRRGLNGPRQVARAVAEVRGPAWLAALTTAAGLASLGLSPIPPIRSFGLVTAAGVLLLLGVFLGLLPPILARWDRRPWPAPRAARGVEAVVGRLARLGVRRAGWVVAAFAVAVAALAPWLGAVRTETDLYRFFPPDHALIQSMRRVEARLAGVTRIEVVFEGPGRDAFLDPARLQAVTAIQDWLQAQPEVDRTLSPADFLAQMNRAFHDGDPGFARVPRSRQLLAQYLLVYDGRDLYDLLDRERQTARLTVNLNVHGANAIQGVIHRLRAHLREQPPADLRWRVAGIGRLFADQEDLLVTGQERSILAAIGVIFLMLALAWRSWRLGLLGMLPNLSPVVVIFALMGMTGIRLDMATALIASVAVGIAVDDTVHMVHGYRQRRRAGRGVALALLRTYRQAGRAVTATTLILGVQFMLLTLSDFRPVAHFGLLSAAGVVTAWLFDLLLLPALLVVAARRQGAPASRTGGGADG